MTNQLMVRAAAEERKYLSDLICPPCPDNIPHQRWDKGFPRTSGDVVLGWYRGQHLAQWECVLALREMGYTRAAERLRKRFRLDEKGNKRV